MDGWTVTWLGFTFFLKYDTSARICLQTPRGYTILSLFQRLSHIFRKAAVSRVQWPGSLVWQQTTYPRVSFYRSFHWVMETARAWRKCSASRFLRLASTFLKEHMSHSSLLQYKEKWWKQHRCASPQTRGNPGYVECIKKVLAAFQNWDHPDLCVTLYYYRRMKHMDMICTGAWAKQDDNC